MDKKIQIRIIILKIICLLVVFFRGSNGYASLCLIQPAQTDSISVELTNLFRETTTRPDIMWSYLAFANVDSLFIVDSIQITLDNESIVLNLRYERLEENNYYRHFSSLFDEADLFLTLVDKYLYGRINTTSGEYSIISLSNRQIFVAKHIIDNIDEEPELLNGKSTAKKDSLQEETPTTKSNDTPIIRVLFLYTSASLTLMPSNSPQSYLKSMIYTLINNANESFYNSNVNARLQLAYLGTTSFNENGMTWSDMLSFYANTDDGYLDEVHSLRYKHSADICVLLINRNEYCGLGYLQADEDMAFCIASPSPGCNSKYSALHEIGHIVGCHHNIEDDDHLSTLPFYAHGFYHYVANNSSSWRTIMSYDSQCQTGCHRILYWSNPNIYYNGDAMGTIMLHNNARVWNERAGDVAGYQTKRIMPIYTENHNNYQSIYESHEAIINITTKYGFEVQPGQTVDFTAPTIHLQARTHIKAGANFRASSRIAADNLSYPQFLPTKNTSSTAIIDNSESINKDGESKNLFPASKLLQNNQILIIRGEHTYTITGQLVQ